MFYNPIMASLGYTINPFMPRPTKGTVANNIDPDQTSQNTASELGLHCIKYINLYNKW